MKLRDILLKAKVKLQKRGFSTPFLDASILLSYLLKTDSKNIIQHYDTEVSAEITDKFQEFINRRLKGEPVSCILQEKYFWDFKFETEKCVLDPRPDSEAIIRAVIKKHSDKKAEFNILDLGTGTGCLIITLLKLYPSARGVAIDISKEALEIAEKNAVTLKVKNRLKLTQTNWNDKIEKKFDVIVSNPPYICKSKISSLSKEVKNYDPHVALDGGENGLDCYSYIAENIHKNLKKNTLLFFEIGDDQKSDVTKIFRNQGFTFIDSEKDFSDKDRVLIFKKN